MLVFLVYTTYYPDKIIIKFKIFLNLTVYYLPIKIASIKFADNNMISFKFKSERNNTL